MVFGLTFHPVFGSNISTDESSYDYGNTINVSGTVSSLQEGKYIILQIINPDNSDIVTADQFLPSSNGLFSKSYPAKGPNWNQEGVYTVKIFYYDWTETTFQLQKEVAVEETSNSEKNDHDLPIILKDKSADNGQKDNGQKDNEVTLEAPKIEIKNLKTIIPNFPSLDKSPDHYFERYDKEPKYREWFDSQFPNQSIQTIVGYQPTHIAKFPDSSKSPQSYMDRYDKEPKYREWFDSQFPNQSIHAVLGFPEPIEIPSWIKDTAERWSQDKIDDATFVSGIQFMIKNKILDVDIRTEITQEQPNGIPSWIKVNAGFWAHGLISDNEFLNGIQYLVANGIIKV